MPQELRIHNRFVKRTEKFATLLDQIVGEVVDFVDFMTEELAQKPLIMSPWLKPGTLALVYAPRGIGKTWVGLSIGLAVTRKLAIGRWKTETPAGVLYVDGEMATDELQGRMRELSKNLPPSVEPLYLLSAERMLQHNLTTPNLVDENWRNALVLFLRNVRRFKVMILDNLASLTPGIDENTKQNWDAINQWLLKLRSMGIAVIMLHHTGKSGDQRGTSAREDNIDVSIKLARPKDYSSEEGARMHVEFTKARGVHGDGAAAFFFQITQSDEGLVWETDNPRENLREVIEALLGCKVVQKEIARMVKCSEPYVSQVKKQMLLKGLLDGESNLTQEGKELYGNLTVEGILAGLES